jgi:hypothetical protein
VHDVLLDVMRHFQTLIARWSALLLTTEEDPRALKDLAEQAEELSMLFVEFDGRRPTSASAGDQLQQRLLLWSRALHSTTPTARRAAVSAHKRSASYRSRAASGGNGILGIARPAEGHVANER